MTVITATIPSASVPEDKQRAARARTGSVSSTDSNAALPSFEALAPPRPPTTTHEEEVAIAVPGAADVRLKVDAGPGCGGIAWPAGEVLTRYIAHRHARAPEHLRGKTVLELGSGTGLVGLAAAMLEPEADVWVTDQDILLDLMRQNAELNLPGAGNIHVEELSWGEDLPAAIPTASVDVILAADCVYFEPAFPLLVKTLCDLAPLGKDIEILFCYKKRRKADKRFFALLKKHFDSIVVEDDKEGEREKYNREGVMLWRLRRRR
ncbi:Protein-lysine N-methyltransferase EFM6 [Vanrija pseudolonga]|uniref:Protein-lysine N-methyltransferase EFM6 n=1 Tax=Vanrija pseudolonga TaxID=143232 RepID=A0AAF0Y4U7_9TREE|nr:Protein-lysine N-methyltransferase EFM6 [Vanrija pseudolonga]